MTPIFPISFFGSIAYYKKLATCEKVIIEAKEHFPKQTYRNRCDILGADGILSLSIPTKKPNGSKSTTDAIILSDEENWRIRHWRAIKSAYQSSPYFDYYGMEVEELIMNKESNFLKFNIAIIERVILWLDLNTSIETSENFEFIDANDLRESLVSKEEHQSIVKAPYIQVFPSSSSYKESLSILDAIFCEGPMARNLLINKN